MNKMTLLEKYEEALQALYDHVGFKEDWTYYPVNDESHRYWTTDGNQVFFGETAHDLTYFDELYEDMPPEERADGDASYSFVIHRDRFYPKHIFSGELYTAIICDTQTDGMKNLSFFSNDKKVGIPEEVAFEAPNQTIRRTPENENLLRLMENVLKVYPTADAGMTTRDDKSGYVIVIDGEVKTPVFDTEEEAWAAVKIKETVNFDNLIGETATLYYCNEINRFQLGCMLFEVIEDEQDGYRSSMEEVQIISNNADTHSNPLSEVRIERSRSISNGYALVDVEDGFIWLTFGTDDYDDYYPCFIFRVNAKAAPDQKIRADIKK